MANPRKTVEQHIADGTYRKDRHGPRPATTSAPTMPPDSRMVAPQKPTDVTGVAGKIWDQLLAVLGGVVRERDGPLLAELCRWWAELKRVQMALKDSKPGDKGYTQLLIAAGICSDKLDKFASRFGLTPADQAKLRADVSNVKNPLKAKVRPKQFGGEGGPPKA